MTLRELKALLDRTGIPVAYRAFPENEAPPLPFICYLETGSDNLIADDHVYAAVSTVRVELYTEAKDMEAEGRLQALFCRASIPWEKDETYIESEKMYQISYEIEVI